MFIESILATLFTVTPIQDKPRDELSFQLDVQPVFESRCVKCHNDNGYLPDITEYDTAYEKRFKIKHKLETREMPYFGKMTESERDTVLEWIKQGAKK